MKYFILITITLILNMGTAMTENAYDHSFKSINEEDIIKLSDYKGKTNVEQISCIAKPYLALDESFDFYK